MAQQKKTLPELMSELSTALTDLSQKMGTLSTTLGDEAKTPEQSDLAIQMRHALQQIMDRSKRS